MWGGHRIASHGVPLLHSGEIRIDNMLSIMDVAPKESRLDRRKAQTRASLVRAAQAFLAEGRTVVSIQEITDRADVGFGSFYNHFDNKDELFNAAVAETLDNYARIRDE